jgi:hypothetical protein
VTVGDRDVAVFFPSTLRISLTIASLAGLGCVGLIPATEGSGARVAGIALAGVVLLCGAFTWARWVAAVYPVHVSPEAGRVYGLRGGPLSDHHWLRWSAIADVSRFVVPLNSCLVLRTHTSERRYWIPLHVTNRERFRELVSEHAGRAHPLTRALYGCWAGSPRA